MGAMALTEPSAVGGMVGLVTSALLVAGAFLLLTAAVGVARMPDFYSRANVSTVATTQGLLSIAVATTLLFSVQEGSLYLKDLLVFLFVFLTVPAGTHMMARAAYRIGVPMPRQTAVDELARHLDRRPAEPSPHAVRPPEASEGLENQAAPQSKSLRYSP